MSLVRDFTYSFIVTLGTGPDMMGDDAGGDLTFVVTIPSDVSGDMEGVAAVIHAVSAVRLQKVTGGGGGGDDGADPTSNVNVRPSSQSRNHSIKDGRG